MSATDFHQGTRPEELFRSIARQRRACISRVRGEFGDYAVTFLHGKVVGVTGQGEIELVQGLLEAGGRLNPALAKSAEFSALEDLLNHHGHDGRTLVMEARRVVAMSRLYQLLIDPSSEATIVSDLVEANNDVMLPVSVGQLMLDVAALMSDGGRLGEILESPVPYEISTDLAVGSLNEQEEEAINLLASGHTPAELEACMLVTRYEFQDLILGLVDRGILLPPSLESEAPFQESFVSALEQSIDSAVAEEISQQHEPTSAATESPQAQSAGVSEWIAGLSNRILQTPWVPNLLVIIILFGLGAVVVSRWIPLLANQ